MRTRFAVGFLIVLALAGLAALVAGLAALAGADVASTVHGFRVGSGPRLRPLVLLPIVYAGIPALCTVAAGIALYRAGIRPGRSARS